MCPPSCRIPVAVELAEKSPDRKSAIGPAAGPQEIAPAWLAPVSPHCSSYITGEILPIFGGRR